MSTGKARPKLKDFLPRWASRRQSPAEQLGVLRAFAARQKGTLEHDR